MWIGNLEEGKEGVGSLRGNGGVIMGCPDQGRNGGSVHHNDHVGITNSHELITVSYVKHDGT